MPSTTLRSCISIPKCPGVIHMHLGIGVVWDETSTKPHFSQGGLAFTWSREMLIRTC